jgi:hypothetical protein
MSLQRQTCAGRRPPPAPLARSAIERLYRALVAVYFWPLFRDVLTSAALYAAASRSAPQSNGVFA